MAFLCLSGFCGFPNGGDFLMYKPYVHKHGESASILVDLTKE